MMRRASVRTRGMIERCGVPGVAIFWCVDCATLCCNLVVTILGVGSEEACGGPCGGHRAKGGEDG